MSFQGDCIFDIFDMLDIAAGTGVMVFPARAGDTIHAIRTLGGGVAGSRSPGLGDSRFYHFSHFARLE